MKRSKYSTMRRRHIPIVVVICFGILLSFLAFSIIRNRELQKIQTDFNQVAWNGINSIQREIKTHIEVLRSVYYLFKGSHDITRKEFQTFCNFYILSHRGIQALEWIPRVSYSLREAYENAAQIEGYPTFQIIKRDIQGKKTRADENKEYFPVYYVEPYKDNETALGFDLATNHVLLEALNKSRDTGEMVATARIAQAQVSGDKYGFLVFLPVYYNQAPTDTVKMRRENLIGFVLGVFRIGKLVEESLTYLKEKDIDFHLYDTSSSQNEQFLSTFLQQNISNGGQKAVQQKTNNKLQIYHTFNVADRKWSVLCKPIPEFIEQRTSWYPWGGLAGGLLFSGLLVAYLKNTTSRKIQIGQYVSKLSTETVERIRVEESLRENEERFRSLAESSMDGILAYDMDIRYTLWNRAMEQISGIKSEELIGKKAFEVFPFLEEVGELRPFKDALKGNPTIRPSMPYNFPETGKSGYYESSHFPLYNTQDQIIGGMAIIRDITDKKQIEEALKESEEKNLKLIDTTQDAIICIDEIGIINVWNRSAERIFGYSRNEIIGQPVTIIIPEKYEKEHLRGMELFLQSGKTKIIGKTVEVTGKTKKGIEIPIEMSLSFQKIGNERYSFTAAIKDITFQKEAKKQLIEKLKEVEKGNKELKDFANIISRNLEEPLLAIEDYSTKLSNVNKKTFVENEKLYIKSIKANTEILFKRIYKIMEVVNIGMTVYDFKNNDIGALVMNVVNSLESEIETNKIKVLIQHNLPNVLCDDKKMRNVFSNLLTNAIKFMGDNRQGEIKVGCEREENNYKFFVEDTGIGIEEKYQAHIFKIFTRLEDIEAGGTGVGLAITKKIVEIHKGRIWVESPVKNGRGAMFCFTIPVMS